MISPSYFSYNSIFNGPYIKEGVLDLENLVLQLQHMHVDFACMIVLSDIDGLVRSQFYVRDLELLDDALDCLFKLLEHI